MDLSEYIHSACDIAIDHQGHRAYQPYLGHSGMHRFLMQGIPVDRR